MRRSRRGPKGSRTAGGANGVESAEVSCLGSEGGTRAVDVVHTAGATGVVEVVVSSVVEDDRMRTRAGVWGRQVPRL